MYSDDPAAGVLRGHNWMGGGSAGAQYTACLTF